VRRENEPIRQGQDGRCRLLLLSGNVVQRSGLWPRTPSSVPWSLDHGFGFNVSRIEILILMD
jgi:hypothetical protein